MKTVVIMVKSLKEQVRDWKMLTLNLLSPVIFMIIFGALFGKSFYIFNLAVLNLDRGVTESDGTNYNAGTQIVEEFSALRYDDGNPIFTVKTVEKSTQIQVHDDLKAHRTVGFLIIPEDFTRSLVNPAAKSSTVDIYGDPSFPSFSLVNIFIQSTLKDYEKTKTGIKSSLDITTHYIGTGKGGSEFQYMAPGLMLLVIYFLIVQCAVVVAREVKNKTLIRLKLASLKSRQFLGGIALSQLALTMIMLPIMFGSAVMMGFHNQGSWFAAFLLGLLASVTAIGIGLIVAAFSKNTVEAFIISNVVIIPMIFISGVFLPPPSLTVLFTLFGREFTLLSFIPTVHASAAINQILIFNVPLKKLVFEIAMLTGLSIAIYIIGAYLFNKRHLKRMQL